MNAPTGKQRLQARRAARRLRRARMVGASVAMLLTAAVVTPVGTVPPPSPQEPGGVVAAPMEVDVVSDDGHTLGPVGHVYLDDRTQQALWVTAKTGLFGFREVFVPFVGARIEPDTLKVRYTKDYILDAPRIYSDGHISDAEQEELLRYFRGTRPGVAPGAEPPADEAGQPGATADEVPPSQVGPDPDLDEDPAGRG